MMANAPTDPPIVLIRPDYPARLAQGSGLVLADFRELVPERDGDPTPDVIRALEAASKWPRVAILARLEGGRPPTGQSREDVMRALRAIGPRLCGAHVALTGSGFVVGAFRSFLTAARLVGAVKLPMEIHSSFPAAKAALAKSFDITPDLSASIDGFLSG